MPKYTIQYIDGKATVIDENGQSIDAPTAWILIRDLARHYRRPCSVYIAHSPKSGHHKIGMTWNVARRMEQLQTVLIKEMICLDVEHARQRETVFHNFFRIMGKHVEGELFVLEADDLQRIDSVNWSPFAFLDHAELIRAYWDTLYAQAVADGPEGKRRALSWVNVLQADLQDIATRFGGESDD